VPEVEEETVGGASDSDFRPPEMTTMYAVTSLTLPLFQHKRYRYSCFTSILVL